MHMAISPKLVSRTAFILTAFGLMPTVAENRQPTAEPASPRVEIVVKARQFLPSEVVLSAGQEVTLVFENQDVELHAFVPQAFLENVPLHVDGNSAPQFGETGLVRVLIPSGGRAEIRFVPRAKGVYHYRCDLPGHQMMGKIVIEAPIAGQDTVRESGDVAQERP